MTPIPAYSCEMLSHPPFRCKKFQRSIWLYSTTLLKNFCCRSVCRAKSQFSQSAAVDMGKWTCKRTWYPNFQIQVRWKLDQVGVLLVQVQHQSRKMDLSPNWRPNLDSSTASLFLARPAACNSWRAPCKNRIYWYISYFRPSLNYVLFPWFCLLVEGECQILVFQNIIS